VYLLLTSPISKDKNIQLILEKYQNIHINYLHIPTLISESTLEKLWKTKKIQSSQFLTSHLSDVVRFLLLKKFGGIYMDLDALTLKPLPNDIPNYVGRESWTRPFIG
jgi:lactosylceramide 4-alpha-galactosyltransferase